MPHWSARLLLKLFNEPSIAISGAAPTAQAFLPDRSGPSILVAHLRARAQRSGSARRIPRIQTMRRRLAS
jgi:hypothetical protein